MKAVTDEKLEAPVVPTMKLMGIVHVPEFNVIEITLQTHWKEYKGDERKKKNLVRAINRFEKNAKKVTNEWFVEQYSTNWLRL